MKKHILITSNFSSDTGFAWKFFFRLFNQISKVLHRKDIGICLSFAKVVEPVTILDASIPFKAFTFDPLNISWKGVVALRKNIKTFNIKYGYFTDFPSWHWLYLFMRLWGMEKIVVHNHISVSAPYSPPMERGLKKLVKKTIQKIRWLTPDSIYVCSNFVKERLVRQACCSENKIEIIFHGIDTGRFFCPNVPCNGEDSVVKIFCVARSTKFKGIHILIEASRLLRDKYSLKHFVVRYGGDGPDMGEFKRLVEQYGLFEHFVFLGVLEDTVEETCRADIVVIPSCWGDALPLSVLEAMAAGKPIVATDVGGIPEEIGSDDCGILIKPGDSDALAKELESLISSRTTRDRLGKNARKRVEALFTEERFYRDVVSCLTQDIGA